MEVELELIALPSGPDHLLPPDEVRRDVALLEERLRAMGLRRRS